MTYEIKKAKVIPSSSASMKTPIADKWIAERHIRQQAIRDCIATVEEMVIETVGNSAATVEQVLTDLRALLEDK